MTLRLIALTAADLGAFEQVLGADDFGGCFCAVWTAFGDDWQKRCQDPARPNYAHTARAVARGRHVGYLVREGERTVGWTGAGPKPALPLLATKLASRLTATESAVWSIGCLAVPAAERGRGLADAIVRAVIDEARRAGAQCLEAYPVRPFHEPRIFRGTYGLYRRLGFAEAASERDGEHEIVLMRLGLAAA